MNYLDIVKGFLVSEEAVESASRVSDYLDRIREEKPAEIGHFLEKEYIAINGKHLNEDFARKIVAGMFHTDKEGNRVEGEAVTPQEAQEMLQGKTEEQSKKLYWDAYVAANGFMHDVSAKVGLSKADNLRLAREFWFNDEDKDDKCHKVFWYYIHKQF